MRWASRTSRRRLSCPGTTHEYSGKVRDLYRAPDGALLFVASDRISAYDWVLPTTIPDKGTVLTQLSLWWFDQVADLVGNHVLPATCPGGRGRARDAVPPPVRCSPSSAWPVGT